MTKFTSQLDKAYQNKVIGTLEKAMRAVALVVDSELVNNTPVDTGRAKNNWLPSLNVSDNRLLEASEVNVGAGALGSFTFRDTILFTNNLPYIRSLNDGSSEKAPAGFVDNAIQVGKNALR